MEEIPKARSQVRQSGTKTSSLSLSSATPAQPSRGRWEELPKLGPTACPGDSKRSAGHHTTCHTDQPTEPYLSTMHQVEAPAVPLLGATGSPGHWEGVFSPGGAMQRFLGERERRPRARAENSSRGECQCVSCQGCGRAQHSSPSVGSPGRTYKSCV